MSNEDLPSYGWYSRYETQFYNELRRDWERFFSITHNMIFNRNNMSTENKQLTRGQEVMSSHGNGDMEDIMAIRKVMAAAYDKLDELVKKHHDKNNAYPVHDVEQEFIVKNRGNDISRCAAIARTNLETACMYAVKAITR